MVDNNKFFNEIERNNLMNLIINTNYDDEDEVWDLALELEHNSIVLRSNILKWSEENVEKQSNE